jgi:hypothetical protein
VRRKSREIEIEIRDRDRVDAGLLSRKIKETESSVVLRKE